MRRTEITGRRFKIELVPLTFKERARMVYDKLVEAQEYVPPTHKSVPVQVFTGDPEFDNNSLGETIEWFSNYDL